MKIIGDPGSCHLASLEKARQLVTLGAACGLDAVKFQLLSKEQGVSGNIGMDWEWMPELMALGKEKGVEVFASVFDFTGISFLVGIGCKSIKFSYRQAYNVSLALHMIPKDTTVYASYDAMSADIQDVVKLYCIPEYPVRYVVDFEGLFPRFDGFSDHTLGFRQTIRAAEAGARVIEKHFQGDWYSDCPDGRFALKPTQLDEMVKQLKR
jgi:sialic acid synthase SpsE